MYVKKTLLFAAHILGDNEIGFMDPRFLPGFNIKEDVFITRGLYFRLLDVAEYPYGACTLLHIQNLRP